MGFSVLRHNHPIQQVSLKNKVNHGITFSGHFEELEACVEAGLDLERWETGLPKPYNRTFKASVIAWYRLRGLVNNHVNEAIADKQKREARKARRKR